MQDALEQVGRVLQAQGVRVRYGDRSTGAQLVNGYFPDTIAQDSVQNGQTRVPGEIKCPWNTSLANGPDRRKVLAQVACYMNKYGRRYGFACTHDELVVMKRSAEFRFDVSPVIRGPNSAGQQTLSVKECFFYLATKAEGPEWKYHGKRQGDLLLNGEFKLSHNLRR